MSSITIKVKRAGEEQLSIEIDSSKTIKELKAAIAEQTKVPVEDQRIIYSGRILKDEDPLVKDGDVVHLVGKGNKLKSKSQSGTNEAASNATTTSQPANTSTLPPANPFGMFGTGYGAGAQGNSSGSVDSRAMSQMLDNPMFAQYMSTMLQNPAMVDNIIDMNPQLSAMGPEIRNMMQSDYFRQMLANPEALRQMGAMSAAMQGAPGMNSPNTTPEGQQPAQQSPFGGSAASNDQLLAMLQGMGGMGGAGSTPPADNRSPEERFQVQLGQMNEMGLWDAAKNIRALQRTGGNVQAAIEILFTSGDSFDTAP